MHICIILYLDHLCLQSTRIYVRICNSSKHLRGQQNTFHSNNLHEANRRKSTGRGGTTKIQHHIPETKVKVSEKQQICSLENINELKYR